MGELPDSLPEGPTVTEIPTSVPEGGILGLDPVADSEAEAVPEGADPEEIPDGETPDPDGLDPVADSEAGAVPEGADPEEIPDGETPDPDGLDDSVIGNVESDGPGIIVIEAVSVGPEISVGEAVSVGAGITVTVGVSVGPVPRIVEVIGNGSLGVEIGWLVSDVDSGETGIGTTTIVEELEVSVGVVSGLPVLEG